MQDQKLSAAGSKCRELLHAPSPCYYSNRKLSVGSQKTFTKQAVRWEPSLPHLSIARATQGPGSCPRSPQFQVAIVPTRQELIIIIYSLEIFPDPLQNYQALSSKPEGPAAFPERPSGPVVVDQTGQLETHRTIHI